MTRCSQTCRPRPLDAAVARRATHGTGVEGPPGRWIRRTHFGVRLAINFTVFVLFMTLVGSFFEVLMYADAAPGTYMGVEVADRRVAFLADISVGVVMFVALFLVFALRRVVMVCDASVTAVSLRSAQPGQATTTRDLCASGQHAGALHSSPRGLGQVPLPHR